MLSFGIGLRTSRQQAVGKNRNEANVLYFSMKMNSRRKSRRTQTSLLQQLTLGRCVKGWEFTDLLPVICTFLVSVILTNSHIFIYSCIRVFWVLTFYVPNTLLSAKNFLKINLTLTKFMIWKKDIEVKDLPFSLPTYFLIFVMPLWNYLLTIYFKQAQKK